MKHEDTNEIISMDDCKLLRRIVDNLTAAPIITKCEAAALTDVLDLILNRLQRENGG